eukprot:scaffold460_cov81-Skeletonema_menzelii.AAC.1
MKFGTALKVIGGLGPALLSSQGFNGVEAPTHGGTFKSADRRRKLEGDANASVDGHAVMGKLGEDETFVATNATFSEGNLDGTLSVAISDSEECTADAYGEASKFQLAHPVAYIVDELGKVGGEGGWFQQRIREIQDNSTLLPVSLAELINGGESEHNLAVYLLGSDAELLGCAFMKKLDEDKAAEYDALLNGVSQDQDAVKDEEPSSGSKIGLFMSAIAAVGIAFVLGDVLAL